MEESILRVLAEDLNAQERLKQLNQLDETRVSDLEKLKQKDKDKIWKETNEYVANAKRQLEADLSLSQSQSESQHSASLATLEMTFSENKDRWLEELFVRTVALKEKDIE